jgi:hypothetical protein
MDRKRYAIRIFVIIILVISVFVVYHRLSKNVIKSCYIEGDELIIVFDISNKSKKPGKLQEIRIFNSQDIFEDDYIIEENEKILRVDCSEYKENFRNNFTYEIAIKWYGGFLAAETVYENGNFIVKKERFYDKI